jgi:uncharacterized SAM-binding protein YcdF (DUF218 family)
MSLLRRIFSFSSILVATWAAGGLIFVLYVTHLTPPSAPVKSDAIIVLTGESNRVGAGIQLLSDNVANQLFISGVDPTVAKQDLQRLHNISPTLLDQITLGYQAKNTPGNAREAAGWIMGNNIDHIRLVTSNYHLPRSRWLLSEQLSDVTIVNHPTTPDWMGSDDWRSRPNNWAKLFREYIKFTLAMIGIQN